MNIRADEIAKAEASSAHLRPFSVVIPAYNEIESIDALVRRLWKVLAPHESELIIVDDGSEDGTSGAIRAHDHVKCIELTRSGKTAALHAGFAAARFDTVVTLDADMQEDPAHIPEFVGALDSHDFVHGWRIARDDPYLAKVFPSRVYNRMVAGLFHHDFSDVNCGFRAMSRELARSMPRFEGAHRLFPVFAHANGCKVASIPVRHTRRAAGRAKFGSIWRFVAASCDLARAASHIRAVQPAQASRAYDHTRQMGVQFLERADHSRGSETRFA